MLTCFNYSKFTLKRENTWLVVSLYKQWYFKEGTSLKNGTSDKTLCCIFVYSCCIFA